MTATDNGIGGWEPRPVVTPADKDRLQAWVRRLREMSAERFPVVPTFDCVCRNTGWIETGDVGRSTVKACRKCGGPTQWCRHQLRKGRCATCERVAGSNAKPTRFGDEF